MAVRVRLALAGLLLGLSVLAACRGQETPAPTPEVSADTPTPAPPTEDLNILYRDDFDDPGSGWPAQESEAGRTGYEGGGVYRVEVRGAESQQTASRSGAFADFVLETSLGQGLLGGGNWRQGVIFRQVTPNDYYAFLINPRGQRWFVLKRVTGAWETLAEADSQAIITDPSAENVLRVFVQGPNLTFVINDQPVVTVNDGTFAAGDLGFIVETLDNNQVQMNVDYVVVRRYNAADVPAAPTAVPPPTATATATATEGPTATNTRAPVTVVPTVNLQTAAVGTLTAVAGTAQAVATAVPPILTQACGLPGLPACP